MLPVNTLPRSVTNPDFQTTEDVVKYRLVRQLTPLSSILSDTVEWWTNKLGVIIKACIDNYQDTYTELLTFGPDQKLSIQITNPSLTTQQLEERARSKMPLSLNHLIWTADKAEHTIFIRLET